MPTTPFLSQIMVVSFNFAPKGWALCNGQLLPINQNQALFSLLGTTYGGDGRVNFALPDLRGRVPISMGSGRTLGEKAGEETHTITIAELATHNHGMLGQAQQANNATPGTGTSVAQGRSAGTGTPQVTIFGTGSPNRAFAQSTITNTGGSQPHENLEPYLTLNFCIALQGIFPSQT